MGIFKKLFHKHKYNSATGYLRLIYEDLQNDERYYYYQNSCYICGKKKKMIENSDKIGEWRKEHEEI